MVLGDERAQHETYIQVAGAGLRISAAKLREATESSATLLRAILWYANAFSHADNVNRACQRA